MPHPESVTSDDDQFINQQNEVAEAMQGIQKALKANDITDCTECAEPIEPQRKAALPSASTCIGCAQRLAQVEARASKLKAKPSKTVSLPPGWTS